MGARQKLNQLHIQGSLGLAAIVGWLAGSWALFTVAGTVLLALNVWSTEIRFARRARGPRDRRHAPTVFGSQTRATGVGKERSHEEAD